MKSELRAVVSTLMILLGIFQAFSGILLYFSPHGRFAGEHVVLFLPKNYWASYHTYVGFALIPLAILHFSLNWKMYVNELKNFFK